MIFNVYSNTDEGLFGINVKSCGHIFAEEGRRIHRPSGREDWLLFYVAKGSERFFLDRETDAEEGSFIIFKPHEKQEHIHLGDKTAEFYYVHFNAPESFDPFGFKSSTVYTAKPSTRVRDMFEEIITELQRKQPCYEKLCVSQMLGIMGLLARRMADMASPHERYTGQIASAIQLMNREYGKSYTLEDYARLCRMSKFHFLRVFKDITGVSPLEYRNNIRIEHAKELLEDTSAPIGEIGTLLGYSSATYFCDAFKKKIGVSPKEYRQKTAYQENF